MSKRLAFTTIEAVHTYAQSRFPQSTAFSRMNASEKSYASVYNMTLPNPTLSQLKQSLEAGCKSAQSTTREKIYAFIAERIVVDVEEEDDATSTLESVKQELRHILEELQVMTPPAPANTPMSDAEHEEWWRIHTEVGMLIDSAHNIALWLVPKEVQALLAAIDQQCTALYPPLDEEQAYDQAKADDR